MPTRASGYIRDGERLENASPIDMPLLTGGGNLDSTIDDLSKWHQALKAGLLISKASYEAMYTPFKANYAYGWVVRTERNRKRIQHGGGVPGFGATIRRFRRRRSPLSLHCD
ncbi:MAG: serine hydrolase [Pyrinomonadaceae bacterium]|nr:serine hydrolase [Pyrinomonadaceae bacterium]